MLPNPILISSPVRRSGTTLLQRLCTGSGEALILGETVANDLVRSGTLFVHQFQTLYQRENWQNEMLERVLAGEVNEWIPDLLPRLKDYQKVHEDLLTQMTDGFGRLAEEYGHPRWGVKLPEWPIPSLRFWQHKLLTSRVVYVVREYEACLESAVIMKMVTTDEEAAQFQQTYKDNLERARQYLVPERTYFLDYAKLCAPETSAAELRLLADFLELQELPASVLAHRIGDYK